MTPHFSLFPITGILFPITGILFPITGITTTLAITTLEEKNESCRYYRVPLYLNKEEKNQVRHAVLILSES